MKLSDLFPKKELTEKEQKERHYKKEMKKIKRKLWKNPTKVTQFIDEATNLMDEMVKDGVMTPEGKEKVLKGFNKDMDKMNKITDKVRKLRGQ